VPQQPGKGLIAGEQGKLLMLEVTSILLTTINHRETLPLIGRIPTLNGRQQPATICDWRQVLTALLMENRGNGDITRIAD
jgi:hypothetical protein